MTLAFKWICVFAGFVLLIGCGRDQSTSDNLPPSTPRVVARSQDNLVSQAGVRAEPVALDDRHWVRLEWLGNPEPDVAGYRLWRVRETTDPLQRYVVKDLHVSLTGDLQPGLSSYSWVDQGDTTDGNPLNMLAPDPESGYSRGYFWYIEAYDESGNRSDYSAPAYYRCLNNPLGLGVSRVDVNSYLATWQYVSNSDVMINYYMLRVYPNWEGPDSVVWWSDPPVQVYGAQCATDMFTSPVVRPLILDSTYVCQLNVVANRLTSAHADSTAGAAVYCTFTYRN
jgi:hypothetical protein